MNSIRAGNNPFKNNEFTYSSCKFANVIITDNKTIDTSLFKPKRMKRKQKLTYSLDEEASSFID